MRFSEREGLLPRRLMVQDNGMDAALANGLWSVLHRRVLETMTNHGVLSVPEKRLFEDIWFSVLKERIDAVPTSGWKCKTELRQHAFSSWLMMYDLIDFVVRRESKNKVFQASLIADFNAVLEREMSAFRFVGTQLARITSPVEVEAVDAALAIGGRFDPATRHIETAVALLSNRKNPDYRNAIKEAISAVESACALIVGQKTSLGDALKQFESKRLPLHPALKGAFEKLYGYTSNADGIRHGMIEDSNVGFEEAKYMLVACAAFVSYLAARSGE